MREHGKAKKRIQDRNKQIFQCIHGVECITVSNITKLYGTHQWFHNKVKFSSEGTVLILQYLKYFF